METPGFIDSKFRLAILAAKRAKQLVSGSRKKIEINAENPLTVALEEIRRGKINFHIFDKNELENLHADSSNDEEDILEALGDVESEDDYEEIDAIGEAEEDNEEKEDDDDDDDDDDEIEEAEEDDNEEVEDDEEKDDDD